jgi:hypothetical protein
MMPGMSGLDVLRSLREKYAVAALLYVHFTHVSPHIATFFQRLLKVDARASVAPA